MLRTDHHVRLRRHVTREIYRENCQDGDGNRYIVLVSEDAIGINTYRLDDGRPVRFIDDCEFEIVENGLLLSRCED